MSERFSDDELALTCEGARQILILKELRRLTDCVCKLTNFFTTAHSATLTITPNGGNMPASIAVGQTATAVLHEWTGPNGTGSEVPPIGPVAYTSSDATIASVDMSSGLVTGVAVGTATITGSDAGNALTAGDSASVTPAVAVSATLVITPSAVKKSK